MASQITAAPMQAASWSGLQRWIEQLSDRELVEFRADSESELFERRDRNRINRVLFSALCVEDLVQAQAMIEREVERRRSHYDKRLSDRN